MGIEKNLWIQTHTCTNTVSCPLSQLLNNASWGLLPQANEKPYFSWYRGGLITQSMCNHMETASHPSFIKPFIAFIAEGALFYELLNNLAVHMYISPTPQYPTFLKAAVRLNGRPPLGYLASFNARSMNREDKMSCHMLFVLPLWSSTDGIPFCTRATCGSKRCC